MIGPIPPSVSAGSAGAASPACSPVRWFGGSAVWFWALTLPMAYYWCVSTFVELDDAYIYYRIAENLAATGRPVFNAGDASFLATSPLWTLLLAAGRRLAPSVDPAVLAEGLFVLGLAAAAWCAYRLVAPRLTAASALIAAPFLLQHQLAKMAGGEIALLLAALFGALWAEHEDRPAVAGLLVGIGMLARGECALLLVPLFVWRVWSGRSAGAPWPRLLAGMGWTVGAAALVVLPVHAWLLWTCGDLFPETLAVKRMQGLSGKWPLYADGLWAAVRQALPGRRLILLPFAVVGAWAIPRAAAGMAGFALLHAITYAAMRIPAYGWYYYDLVLFVPLLVFLGMAQVLQGIAGGIRALRSAPFARTGLTAVLLAGAVVWMFPVHGTLFHPRYASRLWSGDPPGERFQSYREAARRILPELRPGDAVLTSEIGILGRFLPGVEVRDNNGLASPGITAETMNCWACAVDRYRPRFIVFPVRVEEAEKAFEHGGTLHRYRHWFTADPAAAIWAASVYERVDGMDRRSHAW